MTRPSQHRPLDREAALDEFVQHRFANGLAYLVRQRYRMAPDAIFVPEPGEIDPRAHRVNANGLHAVDNKQQSVDIDLDRRKREDLPNFTGLTDSTVIETVLEGSMSSGGVTAIHQVPSTVRIYSQIERRRCARLASNGPSTCRYGCNRGISDRGLSTTPARLAGQAVG